MKILIFDGNSILNRAFYGVRNLSSADGFPTNAIYGFVNILLKALDDEKPEYCVVTFDLKGPTFRHAQYEKYKGTRKGMPDELAVQLPELKKVLDAMNIKRIELEGFEADDLIGTVAAHAEKENFKSIVITGDKDSLQLISDLTAISLVKTAMGRTSTILYDK
ncbi:MAG: DNA polymerase I, partial [Herbinix sp.]|nr:DNA polymerase I [Herbinix sp.]